MCSSLLKNPPSCIHSHKPPPSSIFPSPSTSQHHLQPHFDFFSWGKKRPFCSQRRNSSPTSIFLFPSRPQHLKHHSDFHGNRTLSKHSSGPVLLSPFVQIPPFLQLLSTGRQTRPQFVVKSSLGIPTRDNASSPIARKRPRIIPLPPRLLTSLLPYSGTGEQVLRNLGGPATWLRRAVVSMAVSVLLYNVNVLLTVTAALYWAWSPIILAARGNVGLRLKYKYAGLWRAVVLEVSQVEHVVRTDKIMNDRGRLIARPITESKLRVIVGDSSGARLELLVPVPPTMPRVKRGEPAELLVLSDRRTLSRFNAVREVYLPEHRLWFSEEPSIEHAVFEDVSSDLAAARIAAAQDEEDDYEAKYKFLEEDQELEQFRKSRIGIAGPGGGGGDYVSFMDENRDPMGSSWNVDVQDTPAMMDTYRE